jgi:acyl transferase domain-containing protein/acyl carrier protein
MVKEVKEENLENRLAIIGMACRMPGANNVEEFWNNLKNGVESLSVFTDEELLDSGVDPALISSPHYVKSRGIVNNASHFDASFFGFTPREAELLDPQHRIFLECCWHALEDAAYNHDKTNARIGVYGGVGTNWHLGEVNNHPDVVKFSNGASVVTSNDKDYVTTRVSYKLNLTGPSVNVQTACSTSLVALVLGMNSLLSYQCDMVLVGGATIETPEKKGYIYQEGGMESPDGRCRPFDSNAKGTVFSRGAGVVLLKRLEDAIRDKDHIYAVVLGGAINNDGNVKAGFTAPSVQGQVEVAIEAMERAGVSAESISFVEAHGTATQLGDPIEVSSLSQSFRNYTEDKQFCALGSVKGHIGHTDVASGAAGLIKSALALKYAQLPASLNFESPNPKIDFENSPFFVNTELRELRRNGTPLRALVNSFGVGGTNACIILEEPPETKRAETHRQPNVLVLSAKTDTALNSLTENLKRYVEKNPDLELNDIAYTCQTGRKSFRHRRFVVFNDRDDLVDRLNNPARNAIIDTVCEKEDRPVIFAFPGQGNQYVGMGCELYQNEKVFRDTVDECCELLTPILDLDLRDIIFAQGDAAAAAADKLNQTYITQPSLFVISYAHAKLWMSMGIMPAAMVGHSVGEYVAACLSGVLSLEDALKAVARRGKLIQDLPGGSMLAVLMPEEKVLPFLTPTVEIAAVNSPNLTVVAGPTPDIAELENRLTAEKIFHKRLDTSHAFHSAMMEPALPEFAKVFADIKLNAPAIPIASTVTGKWLAPEEATDSNYWVQHVRRAVRFSDAVQTILASDTPYIILESGPGHSLESAVKYQLDKESPHTIIGSMRAATDAGHDTEFLLNAVGKLWAAGHPISWDDFYSPYEPRRVSIPGYPFERQKFALDFKNKPAAIQVKDNEKKKDIGEWFYFPSWKRTPSAEMSLLKQENGAENTKRCWIIFKDESGLSDAIVSRLERLGDEVITVSPADDFAQAGDNNFFIRPRVKNDYEELVKTLKNAGKKPGRILHLWNVESKNAETTLELIDRMETLAFYSPLFIEQSFIKLYASDNIRLIVAANGAFDVAGEGVQNPAKALSLGPCRVIGNEFPTFTSRFVDIELPQDAKAIEIAARNIIDEALLNSGETVAAYRRGYRWTENYDPVYLNPAEKLPPVFRENGVFLITGGLGGLSLAIARHITKTIKANFVLIYRSTMPERGAWENWLAEHGENDSTSEKIRGVLELEKSGNRVMLAEADVTDLQNMARVKREAEEILGKINGVIHSAGTAGGGILSLKTEEMAAEVLDPKVKGTLVLDNLFGKEDLDFFILFSTITSVLGEAGRGDYCAANCFMDAFVNYRNCRRPQFMTSLNWGAWGEIGMAARWEETKAKKKIPQAVKKRDENSLFIELAAKDGQQEIYEVLLDPVKDWIINSHLVFGIPTLVGTAFLEIVYQFAELKNPGQTPVLENKNFISPLMFEPDKEKRVRLFVQETGGKFKFAFKSQLVEKDANKGFWHEHFKGELLIEPGNGLRRFDLDELSARTNLGVDTEPFYIIDKTLDMQFLDYGQRWDSLKEVKIGEKEWLAKIELDENLSEDLQTFSFHPALADLAFAAAVKLVVDTAFLPSAYKKIELKAPFTSTLWSHLRLNGEFQPGAETVSFDITIMNPDGKELATVERYSLKRITAMPPPKSTNGANGNGAKPSGKKLSQTKDILPAEGLDAFDRILNAPFIPQVVISTSNLYALIEESKPGAKKAEKDNANGENAPKTVAYSRPSLATAYEEPANEIEKTIAEIWQGILGIGQVGANDDFTALGGNSLLAVQVVANTSDAFQLELAVESFYQRPTVRGMAETVLESLVLMAGEENLEELISTLEE